MLSYSSNLGSMHLIWYHHIVTFIGFICLIVIRLCEGGELLDRILSRLVFHYNCDFWFPKRVSLGAMVRLLPCDLAITGSHCENNLFVYGVRICAYVTCPSPDPIMVGASC